MHVAHPYFTTAALPPLCLIWANDPTEHMHHAMEKTELHLKNHGFEWVSGV